MIAMLWAVSQSVIVIKDILEILDFHKKKGGKFKVFQNPNLRGECLQAATQLDCPHVSVAIHEYLHCTCHKWKQLNLWFTVWACSVGDKFLIWGTSCKAMTGQYYPQQPLSLPNLNQFLKPFFLHCVWTVLGS